MKDCPVCGNDIPAASRTCVFCGAELTHENETAPGHHILHKRINLEYGRPFVETAIKRLENELSQARMENVKVLSVIHGYGSSGKGGKIKIECRKMLDHLQRRGELKNYIGGEEFSKRGGAGKALLRQFSGLEELCLSDFNNPGVTLVVI